MRIEFDPAKSTRNEAERGLPFSMAEAFDFASAMTLRDERKDYPESRFVATGYIGDRLFVLCYTPISGGIRIISFRKANSREVRRYEQETSDRR
ncbi:BrnT family toxin [Aureimonas leprariae]|uniref:BrnT family toxin n=1 Tax=Plantimonas leprariae TaxID=2615207 RepID=A0A7V7PRA5_9HYPH|nr:BrnT family toxin [Aureimonas leprariae]KAB0681274.1 BrnT family toxin [Aureimonas leprariae]